MIDKQDLNKLMVLLIKRELPEEVCCNDQHWIGMCKIDDINYFICKLCKEKLSIVPYDNWRDPKISYEHSISHIKEYNLLALL